MTNLRFLLTLLLVNYTESIRLCVWDSHRASKLNANKQQIQQIVSIVPQTPYIITASESIRQKIKQEVKILMNKGEQFRSYHPHYLHSYSYPQPITPHVYIGQVIQNSRVIFYVKDNQTFNSFKVRDMTSDIFYINRKSNHDHRNQPQVSKQPGEQLKYIMVMQIQNMLTVDLFPQIMVYNFKDYLGIICDLGQGDYHAFLFYVSKTGNQVVSMNKLPQDITLNFRNESSFNSKENWMNAQRIKWTGNNPIKLQGESFKPLYFMNIIIQVSFTSLQSANAYKICLNQFKKQADNETISQILMRMQKVRINTYQYRFDVKQKYTKQITCQSDAQSQLYQGISYQYGNLILKNGSKVIANEPKELLSFTPSRKRFPWGFLWDDGFHCEVAIRSEGMSDMAIKVIKSWLDTMTENGWMPREQNRGNQRQFLCSCPQFMTKDIKDGNPPTLMLSLHYLAKKKLLSEENFQVKYYQKLKLWYSWFFNTQQTSPNSFIFRWHDSINMANQGSFNSGLDDFPRLPQTFGHVDCQSWMYMFSQAMADISFSLDKDGMIFIQNAQKIKEALKDNFIDPSSKLPKDYSVRGSKKTFSPHFGYPSILPIAFGMMNQSSQQFNKTFTAVRQELDSGSGLTSISMKSNQYLSNKDAYWRGPVWININYLFLKGLFQNYPIMQQKYYHKLRIDLINTVCGNWQGQGYFYENYVKGKGTFSYPFTGWTALISIIIKEDF